MKVKEYLVNRILELEKELKQTRNEQAGTKYGLQKLQEEVIKLNEKLEQYQIEREHIKQIITCNLEQDSLGYFHVDLHEDADFKTLMAILDIKPEDYTESQKELVHEFDYMKPNCDACIHKDISPLEKPCNKCGNYRNSERRTEDAEATD